MSSNIKWILSQIFLTFPNPLGVIIIKCLRTFQSTSTSQKDLVTIRICMCSTLPLPCLLLLPKQWLCGSFFQSRPVLFWPSCFLLTFGENKKHQPQSDQWMYCNKIWGPSSLHMQISSNWIKHATVKQHVSLRMLWLSLRGGEPGWLQSKAIWHEIDNSVEELWQKEIRMIQKVCC